MWQLWMFFGLMGLVESVAASGNGGFDFGDTLALIIGLFIAAIGFFACMGAYARRLRALSPLV